MSTSITPCYPLIELLRYVDSNGIPSKVHTLDVPGYVDEEAVIVSVPSRVLKTLRALAAGEYVVQPTRMMDYTVSRRVAHTEETVIADGFTDESEAEEARACLERMKAGRPKKGGTR